MHFKNAYQIMKSALWDSVKDNAMTLGIASLLNAYAIFPEEVTV